MLHYVLVNWKVWHKNKPSLLAVFWRYYHWLLVTCQLECKDKFWRLIGQIHQLTLPPTAPSAPGKPRAPGAPWWKQTQQTYQWVWRKHSNCRVNPQGNLTYFKFAECFVGTQITFLTRRFECCFTSMSDAGTCNITAIPSIISKKWPVICINPGIYTV